MRAGSAVPGVDAVVQLFTVTELVAERVQLRLGGAAGSGAVTLSSAGGEQDLAVWASLSGLDLTGAAGSGGSVTVGADLRLDSGGIVGAYLAQDWLEATDGTTLTKSSTPAVGVYVGLPLQGGLVLDGHLGVARPDYTVAGEEFSGRRVMGAVGVTGRWQASQVTVRPGLRLAGYGETVAAHLSGGVTVPEERREFWSFDAVLRVEPTDPLAGGWTPYGAASVGRAVLRSSVDGRSSYDSPQAEIGVTGHLGAGAFNASLTGGAVSEGRTGLRLTLGYALAF